MEPVFLTKEMLLTQRDKLAIERVDLLNDKEEVRGYVFVREMTAKEKGIWELSLTKRVPVIGGQQGKNKPKEEVVMNLDSYRTKLAICTVCDEAGKLLFDMNPNTIRDLGDMLSASNMERIADVANRLNKITEEDQEELVKNLGTEQNEDSNSDSVPS